MRSFNYLSEFNLNIEDISITIICDNPPDEIPLTSNLNQAQKSKTTPLHNHVYYELFNVIEGTLTLHFEKGSITLHRNSSIIIPPMIFHVCSKEPNSIVEAIDFQFKSNKLKSTMPLYNIISKTLVPPYYTIIDDYKMMILLKNLHSSIEKNDYLQVSLLFHRFVLLLFNAANDTSNTHTSPVDSNIKRLYKIQQTISRDYSKDIKLETIANMLFLSPRQVNRLIKQHMGHSFKEYLTIMRMNAASEYLITTNIPISEIYNKVGYNSLQSFYVAFQKHFSCTPIEYRERESRK